MRPTTRTFESLDLQVDYLTFKFQTLDPSDQLKIANDLVTLGFNSYQESAKWVEPIQEPICVHSKNAFRVRFVIDHLHWDGTLLHVSGANAAQFYRLWKDKKMDLTLWTSSVLTRFDLCYARKTKKQERSLIPEFLENCHKKLKQTNKNVNFEKNSKGLILKIGNRRSNQFSRIYQKKDHLRFEHEMKGRFLQNSSNDFMNHDFESFESFLSQHFLVSFGRKFPLDSVFFDWLVLQLRVIRSLQIPKSYFNSHYLCPTADFQSFEGRTHFFHLLQFLVYVQNLDYRMDQLGTTSFRLCVFCVQDFLTYLDPNVRPTNYYQLKKVLLFLDELQKNSIIKSFSDKEFRSLVTIPELKLFKSTRNRWMVEVWIAEELFYYSYPFLLPDLRKRKFKYAFEVQFQIIQTFSSIGIEKVFLVQEFFNRYPSVIPNHTITKIKREFLLWVETLEEFDLIEKKYKIIQKGQYYSVSQLTTENISEGFVLYEKIFRSTS